MRGRCKSVDEGKAWLARPAAARGLATMIALAAASPCMAQDPESQKYGWREVWTGADAMRDVWLLYTGITLAPWNEHVYDPGWRVRVQSGYGHYDYTLEEPGGLRTYRGSVNFVDALAGYHFRTGALTTKLFAGVSLIDHAVRPGAARGRVVGAEWGPKVAAELWLDLTPAQWTSLNANFTTAHNTISARWRYGVNATQGLSIGPELRIDSNAGLFENYGDLFEEYEGRAGLFAAYSWNGHEITIAGGVAAYMRGTAGEDIRPYATINFLTQF